MSVKIYNTLTRKKEPFEPLEPGKVLMYVCGPTVYDKAHVGHAMSVLVFDIIRRYLEYQGYKIKHVSNYTDIDDKIIQRAAIEEVEYSEISKRYIQEFEQHLKDLNILPANIYPLATEEISHIIKAIEKLIEKGYAYPVEGDVYYRVRKFNEYGKLSGRNVDDMEAGTRIAVDARKEQPMDFALWKAAKPGEPFWASPWGKGRPGWHIECSVMSLVHLGEQIDIHGGGNDLIFPHHENEIAQSEALNGKQFAKYWVHHGMMQLSGTKMSKSLGNLVTVDDFLEQYGPDTLRMMILNSSYRSPLIYNDETIQHAQSALQRLRSALRPARPQENALEYKKLREQTEITQQKFIEAMDDDFNTAGALGHLFDLVRTINQSRDQGADAETLSEGQLLLRELTGVLGLNLELPEKSDGDIAPFVNVLIETRNELRDQKLWALSDKIRDQLLKLDIVLEDGTAGTTWHWK
ncbi:MAG: cysteine--tRNA ligase [Chloroflexota bacterium]|nr:MAG: cysteine--tRNA ligase [Chloroflexota bacterium]